MQTIIGLKKLKFQETKNIYHKKKHPKKDAFSFIS